MSYRVEVTREDDAWIADVTNLPGAHTFAKSLTSLHAAVVEVIQLVTDSEDDPAVNYSYVNVSRDFLDAARIGEERERLDVEQRHLQSAAAVAVRRLSEAGWSVRDISGVLKMTPGRVSQITSERRAG